MQPTQLSERMKLKLFSFNTLFVAVYRRDNPCNFAETITGLSGSQLRLTQHLLFIKSSKTKIHLVSLF